MSRRRGLVLCAIATVASACGGDLPEQSAPRCVAPQNAELARLEGIYEMSYRTHNPNACDAEGHSVLEIGENKWLTVRRSTGPEPALVVGECHGLEWCRGVASGSEYTVFLAQGRFDCSIGDGSLYGESVQAGTLAGEQCTGASHSDGFIVPEGSDELRIESKQRDGDYAAPPRGCSVEAAEQASATMRCKRDVFRAKRVEAL
jgi:hypothetical protein